MKQLFSFFLLALALGSSATYGQQTAYRLIAEVDSFDAPDYLDSFSYHYSNGRGGGLGIDPYDRECDTAFKFTKNIYPWNPDRESRYCKVFDYTTKLYATQGWSGGQYPPSLGTIKRFRRDSLARLIGSTLRSVWNDLLSTDTIDYDAAGNLERYAKRSPSGSAPDFRLEYHNSYDSQNRLIQYAEKGFDASGSSAVIYWRQFSYNAMGKISVMLIGTGPINTPQGVWKDSNIYDGSGRLSRVITSVVNPTISANWLRVSYDSMAYNPNGSIAAYFQIDTDTSGVPAGYQQRRIYSYDADTNATEQVLSESFDGGNSFLLWRRWIQAFVPPHLLTYYKALDWNPNINQWTPFNWRCSKYYWESYTPAPPYVPPVPPATSAVSTVTSIPELSVFPNPSYGAATLRISWPKAQKFSVLLHDAAGRVVNAWYPPEALTNWRESLSTTGMKPGVYFISVTANGKTTTAQFVVQ